MPRLVPAAVRSMTSLLTLDAGLQTGWALFCGGELTESGTLDFREGMDWAQVMDVLPKKADRVVMEVTRPHYGRLYQQLRVIQHTLLLRYPQCEMITALQWKPSHDKAKLPRPCRTQHERDAVRMGLWALTQSRRVDTIPT